MRICLAIALVACGGSSNHAPDAASDDAAPDVPGNPLDCTPRAGSDPVTVDGPSGPVTLAVTFFVHDPTGALVSMSSSMPSETTVQLAVPSCGMVTVFENDPG